ncbi:hypothetical protein LSTR_LSTR013327 [Laodelphax striatellus]|uniref:Uncharacterized protein n=1 Tax=Laodelphax striatellus TaxID=195883 RepID=A0A482WI76_LAOST|nr:hypothetical protein LSTR_LSTR013327 [Laodelphax striatellus]
MAEATFRGRGLFNFTCCRGRVSLRTLAFPLKHYPPSADNPAASRGALSLIFSGIAKFPREVVELLAVSMSVLAVGCLSYDLVDIPFPCDRDSDRESELVMNALEFVCVADKQDPVFEKFLEENGFRRDKRGSKLLNALTSSGNQQQMENPVKGVELPETSENVFLENVINQILLSNLQPASSGRTKRKASSEGPNFLEKIYDCCQYSHRVRTHCTLRDVEPYCPSYIKNGQGS